MEPSILSTIVGMLDGGSIDQIASASGASSQSVLQGLKFSIGAVLAGMASKSEDYNSLRTILDLAPTGEGIFPQIAHTVADPNSALLSAGRSLISAVFGTSGAAVSDAVAAGSGLHTATSSTLLAAASALVTSVLSRRVRMEGLTMHALGDLLQQESGAVRHALPGRLAGMLYPATGAAVSPVAARAVAPERTVNWLPLLALALLIPALLWLVRLGTKPTIRKATHVTVVTPRLGSANRAVIDPIYAAKQDLANIDLKFDTGSVRLRGDSDRDLDKIAASLNRYPDVHMTVNGYTDNLGSSAQNVQLSQERADRVVAELVQRGVPADRLSAEGHGDADPVADNATEAGRAQNRRITLDFSQH